MNNYNIQNTKYRIKRSLQWAFCFIGFIIGSVFLWVQVIEAWNMHLFAVVVAIIGTVFFIPMATYSLWRSVGE